MVRKDTINMSAVCLVYHILMRKSTVSDTVFKRIDSGYTRSKLHEICNKN